MFTYIYVFQIASETQNTINLHSTRNNKNAMEWNVWRQFSGLNNWYTYKYTNNNKV